MTPGAKLSHDKDVQGGDDADDEEAIPKGESRSLKDDHGLITNADLLFIIFWSGFWQKYGALRHEYILLIRFRKWVGIADRKISQGKTKGPDACQSPSLRLNCLGADESQPDC